ncbi:nuclear transport factor 2 family protein [Microcoleus sp. herbarium14]|uniref:nuclear transport factor 2 family protein n=1 Tax=Microcoleus sp. herbarium14 TaxID=3055439 RepID=UPI002FD4F3A3
MSNTTGNMSAPAQHETPTVLQRMSDAINAHDVDALVSCFANDYKGEQPLHPESAFTGLAQVRENWTGLFAQVPDLRATLVASTIDDDFAWAELSRSGMKPIAIQVNLYLSLHRKPLTKIRAQSYRWFLTHSVTHRSY